MHNSENYGQIQSQMTHHGEVTQSQREPHLMIILIHFAKMALLQLTSMKTGATLFKIMNEFNLTHSEIRQASTTKLRNLLKEDIDVDLHDMINYELYIREYS